MAGALTGEMQEVRVRYSVEYETVVVIPKGDDPEARRDAMLDALDAIDIPETKESTYVDDSFSVIEFTDPANDKTICRELRLT